MPGNTISGSGLLGVEIAALFPHFDPFVSRTQQKAARRLILFHHDPMRTDQQIEELAKIYCNSGEGENPEIFFAMEGQEIIL